MPPLTAAEALRRAGFGHRNATGGTHAPHEVYRLATGEVVAELHAREVWAWLRSLERLSQ